MNEWFGKLGSKIVLLHLALIIPRPKKGYNFNMWPCNKAVLPCPKTLLNMQKHIALLESHFRVLVNIHI